MGSTPIASTNRNAVEPAEFDEDSPDSAGFLFLEESENGTKMWLASSVPEVQKLKQTVAHASQRNSPPRPYRLRETAFIFYIKTERTNKTRADPAHNRIGPRGLTHQKILVGDALCHHGGSNLQEASAVCTDHQVALGTGSHRCVIGSVEDALHDALQLGIHFLEGPPDDLRYESHPGGIRFRADGIWYLF